MERLTKRMCGGWGLNDGCNLNTLDGMREVVDRLAAYEDTGLEPEEVTAIKNAIMGQEIAKITEFDGIPIRRLQELAKAEKDGRLVVLPCIKDTVYTIEEDYFNCGKCRNGSSAHYIVKIDRVSCDMDSGEHCPFYVKEHEVGGFEIFFDTTRKAVLSAPGEFGYEGLEQFSGIDGKVYYTREEAEAALKRRERAWSTF